MSGLASGALGSFGASAWGAMVGDQFAKSAVGTIAFGALRGGVGAEFTDGNFWQGVLIGGMVAGLNHTMHRGADEMMGDGERPRKTSRKFTTIANKNKFLAYAKAHKNDFIKFLRSSFDAAEVIGGTTVIGGVVLEPVTGGLSTTLIVSGEAMSTFGTFGNVTLDLLEGNYGSANYRIMKWVAFAGTGSALEKIPYTPFKSGGIIMTQFTDAYLSQYFEKSFTHKHGK